MAVDGDVRTRELAVIGEVSEHAEVGAPVRRVDKAKPGHALHAR